MQQYKFGATKFKRYCAFLKRCISFMNEQLLLVNDIVAPLEPIHHMTYQTTSYTNGCHVGRHLFEGKDFRMLEDVIYATIPTLGENLELVVKKTGLKEIFYIINDSELYFMVDDEKFLVATRIPESANISLTFNPDRLYFDNIISNSIPKDKIIGTSKTDQIVQPLLSGQTMTIGCTHDNGIVRLNKNMFKCLTTSKTSFQFEYVTKPVNEKNTLPSIILHVWYKNDVEMIHAYSFGDME